MKATADGPGEAGLRAADVSDAMTRDREGCTRASVSRLRRYSVTFTSCRRYRLPGSNASDRSAVWSGPESIRWRVIRDERRPFRHLRAYVRDSSCWDACVLRPDRRNAHQTDRAVVVAVQRTDTGFAHVELVPGTAAREARGTEHRGGCSQWTRRLSLAAGLRHPRDFGGSA